jgi:flagellar biosynthesis protein FlhA
LTEVQTKAGRSAETGLALGVLGILVVLILPLPPALLDILITLNVSISFLVLLTTLSADRPLDLSTFPSMLLIITLLRLGLNVASTRLILMEANPGSVIRAFGDFVVGGDLLVGVVIFLILIIIQFVVITKGAGRISEVAARFTLDAMPGKQMAIDADLNTGLLTPDEARTRREAVSEEAEFYGAMDGASKFVRGDAIAGLIITAVNIIGGVAMGMTHGLTASDALSTYAVLTIGDGLVSQIPALVIATSAGILTTKAANKKALAPDILGQFSRKPRTMGTAALVVGGLGLVPGLPIMPFMTLAGALTVGYVLSRKVEVKRMEEEEVEAADVPTEEGDEPSLEDLLRVDRLGIEIGYRLISLVDREKGGGLLEHIAMLRRQIALDYGMIVPPVRIKDNLQLEPGAYIIRINGQEVASGALSPSRFLAMDPGTAQGDIEGIETTEPTFGLPAKWVTDDQRAEAEMKGFTVIDPASVLVTHLSETIKANAHEILSRDDVQELLDNLKERSPTVIEELVPNVVTVGEIHKVLRGLLREKVPIRNLITILEVIADTVHMSRDSQDLVEAVRTRLGRTICRRFEDDTGSIAVITIDPALEGMIAEGIDGNGPGLPAAVAPKLIEAISNEVKGAIETGREPVLLTKGAIRRILRDLVLPYFPRIAVLSYNEIVSVQKVRSIGVVRLESGEPSMQGVTP